jgi:hypothetical protein
MLLIAITLCLILPHNAFLYNYHTRLRNNVPLKEKEGGNDEGGEESGEAANLQALEALLAGTKSLPQPARTSVSRLR